MSLPASTSSSKGGSKEPSAAEFAESLGIGKTVIQPITEAGKDTSDTWLHGELFFEETNRVCKYLIPPETLTDPTEILSVMLNSWGLSKPSMVCCVQSGDGDYNETFKQQIEVDDAGKTTSIAELLSNEPTNWGADENSQREKYKRKLADLMHGVVSATTECSAWLVAGVASRHGGMWSSAALEPGMSKYRQSNPGMIGSVQFVGFLDWDFESGCLSLPPKSLWPISGTSILDKAVPLSKRVEERVVYPAMQDHLNKPVMQSGRVQTGRIGAINPWLSHLVLTRFNTQMVELLETMVPSVYLVVAGKNKSAARSGAFDRAQRGAQVLLMQNTGIWVNMLVKAVLGEEVPVALPDSVRCELPDGIERSRFLIFDALRDSADMVIDKLTKALTMVGGDDTKELGFPKHEKERLRYAWDMRMKFEYNAQNMRRYSLLLQWLLVLSSLATTAVAVLSTASTLKSGDAKSNQESLVNISFNVELTHAWRAALAVACAALPLLSTLLLSCSSQFSPQTKHAELVTAAARLVGEIYRYRTRSGVYHPKMKNRALQGVMGVSKPSGTDSNHESRKETSSDASPQAVLMGRSLFAEQVNQIHQFAMMSGGMQLDNLQECPENFRMQLVGSLYSGTKSSTSKATGKDSEVKGTADVHPLLDVERGDDYSALDAILQEDAKDDGISLLTAEDYLKFRVKTELERLKLEIPGVHCVYVILRTLVFIASFAAGILGLLGLRVYIPLTVAFASAVESFLSFDRVQARLSSLNGSRSQLEELIVWWSCLSMVERRMANNKDYLVDCAEQAIEAAVAPFARAAVKQKAQKEEQEDKDTTKNK